MQRKKLLQSKRRIRAKISGSHETPRISVFKSNKYIYVQAIDDEKQTTLVSAFGKKAEEVGTKMGEKMVKSKIINGVFDRNGYKYHGNVKILAEAIRKSGVKF